MAKTGVGGALAGVGRALMRREDIEREDSLLDRQDARQNELMGRQDARQDALLTRQEGREDLAAQRQEALQLAIETREAERRSRERAEDRTFQGEMLDRQLTNQNNLAANEAGMLKERWSREDIRALEEQSTGQLAALDSRIQDLRDMQLKGEVLGEQGEVDRQISEAGKQKLMVRWRLIERLYEMGDARYKDMPADQRAIAAGFSKDQVADFMRAQNGEEWSPAPEGPSDADVAATVRGTDPARVASYGLSPEDRAALGLPAEPAGDTAAMAVPESPPPLRDMTQAGRGRRTVTGRGGAQVTDVGGILKDLFAMREPVGERRTAPGRGAPQPPKDAAEVVAAKNVLNAMRSGFNIDTMKDIQTMRRMTPPMLRSLGYSDDEIRRAKKQPPHRRP